MRRQRIDQETDMHWLRTLLLRLVSRSGGEAVSAPAAEPGDARVEELADYCRDHHVRGRDQENLDDWEWRKRRNPEWTSLTSEELAAISPDPTALDRAEHERLIEKWKAEQHGRSADPTPSPAHSIAGLAADCRTSFERDRIDEERAFKEWRTRYRERAADFYSGG